MKNLLSIADLTKDEIVKLLNLTHQIKIKTKKGKKYQPLIGKTLAMIFQKPSTRTRVSFEVGMTQLGGHPLFLSVQDMQVKRGETFADTAQTLSRYVDGIMIRVNTHNDILELAKHSVVPIINGLSDLEHPCQVLGDIYTILEKKVKVKTEKLKVEELKNIKVTYVGDGNNVANSLLLATSILGMELTVSSPPGYEPDKEILTKSIKISKTTGAVIDLIPNPHEAVKNSDIIYTDVWISMGKEAEQDKRKQIFKEYRVDKELISKAKPDVLIMHCLPAHRGEEITDEVIDGPHSIVFDQAENRLYVQKAILVYLL